MTLTNFELGSKNWCKIRPSLTNDFVAQSNYVDHFFEVFCLCLSQAFMETLNPIHMSCLGLLKTFMETIKPSLHVSFVYVTNFHENHWDVTIEWKKTRKLDNKKFDFTIGPKFEWNQSYGFTYSRNSIEAHD